MGPGNWRMARMVDEIPNVVSHLPPPDAQSFLVLSHLADCDKVIHQLFCLFLCSSFFPSHRSLRDVEVDDVRSDDEDDDDDDEDTDAKED
jgi:hypothetical protein